MANTDVLFCEAGQHEWEREKKRGRKPTSCPEHKPTIDKSKLPPEEAARRRAEGRARAKAERDKDGIACVVAYKKWVAEDTEITIQRRLAAASGERPPARAMMPRIPTKAEWVAAAEAGVHKGIMSTEDDD